MFLVKCVILITICNAIYTKNLQDDRSRHVRKRDMSGSIVGGLAASKTMFSHFAYIAWDGVLLCGGSIISVRVILTAAHCLVFPYSGRLISVEELDVYLGSSEPKKGAKYKVCKILPHENYIQKNYDIGLILLQRSIIFGTYVQKISIAQDEKWKNSKHLMTVAGFGALSTNGGLPKILQMTRMRYVDSKLCNKSQSGDDYTYVPRHMFCMLGSGWTSDCFGDSGSGVIWRKHLIGVVSTGRDGTCGSDVMPSMYTNVVRFKKWITSNVAKLQSISTQSCLWNSQRTRVANLKNGKQKVY